MSFLDETTNATRKNQLSTLAPFLRREEEQGFTACSVEMAIEINEENSQDD